MNIDQACYVQYRSTSPQETEWTDVTGVIVEVGDKVALEVLKGLLGYAIEIQLVSIEEDETLYLGEGTLFRSLHNNYDPPTWAQAVMEDRMKYHDAQWSLTFPSYDEVAE